ncbi:MAG TPA: phosphatase PAP2 family protein [Caulobacteraceae bacterium]|jgi:acid phosphatase (class A)|nr:phosphatase PAP2 family protein [Caulobacteraceae bacterium]
MVRRILPPLAAAGLILASFAVAQTPPPPVTGYLTPDTMPQTLRILPPPPPAGSGRQADDEAIFARTRALKGDPRWALATSDADMHSGPSMFACAVGIDLNADNAPTLKRLFSRAGHDALGVVDPPKDSFNRPRPYVGAAGDPPICVEKTDALAKSPSYPSGHSTLSWAWGLILAELVPDRSTEILMRARAIGESRVICGVHYLSDVDEGRTNGSALVAALHSSPEFRADMDKARAEIAAARQTPHVGPGDCLDTDQAAQQPLN